MYAKRIHRCTSSAPMHIVYLPLLRCRTLVPVSVVSVWTIQLQPRGYSEFALSAALKYVAVGVPPGLQLKELATVTVPLLNTMKVSSQLMSSGLLVAMPYVGEVDLNLNSDPSNVAITSIPAGQTEFVVRGTVSLRGLHLLAGLVQLLIGRHTCTLMNW